MFRYLPPRSLLNCQNFRAAIVENWKKIYEYFAIKKSDQMLLSIIFEHLQSKNDHSRKNAKFMLEVALKRGDENTR